MVYLYFMKIKKKTVRANAFVICHSTGKEMIVEWDFIDMF